MLSAEQKDEMYDVELLAMVESFKTWRNNVERASCTILILTDYINPKKFMEKKFLSSKQIH